MRVRNSRGKRSSCSSSCLPWLKPDESSLCVRRTTGLGSTPRVEGTQYSRGGDLPVCVMSVTVTAVTLTNGVSISGNLAGRLAKARKYIYIYI